MLWDDDMKGIYLHRGIPAGIFVTCVILHSAPLWRLAFSLFIAYEYIAAV